MLTQQLKALARAGLEFVNTYAPESRGALAITRLERTSSPGLVEPGRHHADAAIAWIKRAQDVAGNGGVAWGYRARRRARSTDRVGWVNAYPETTGYIIPTMFRYGDLTGDEDAINRARRMLDWELSIQLADGGFQGGVYGASPVSSSTFDTGQVLFGLVSGYYRFRDERIRTAAVRAGDWLLSCLDENGRFVRGYSKFSGPGAKAYEARTGLALAELGDLLNEEKYRVAASKIADYTLSTQQPNGWFSENDIGSAHSQPSTHPIGYVMEGLHGIGLRLGRQECIDATARTLSSIVPLIRSDGFLAGRLTRDWSPAVDWVCLTGSAQIAGAFVRLYSQTGNRAFLDAGKKLLGFVSFTQELHVGVEGLDGGVRGSYPFGGGYLPWCTLNWATKFFADSVLDYLEANERLSGRSANASPA